MFLCEKKCEIKDMLQPQEMITKIQDVANVSMPRRGRVLLFGSQARGDAHEDSDWDLLILLDKPRIENSDFDTVAYPIIEMGWRMGIAINPLLYTYSDWNKRHFTPFYQNVLKDGIELWH